MIRLLDAFIAVCLLLAVPLTTICVQEGTVQAQDVSHAIKKKYDELRERVKQGDKSVDFVALISASSDLSLSQKGIVNHPSRDDMVAAFKAKDYKRATELAESVLDDEFTNGGLHRATENAYRTLGNNTKADFHAYLSDQILKAILSTGNGETTVTAYCVQGINEEYQIMRHFGYGVSSQALVMSEASSYDVLTGTNSKTKKTASLYFDISGHFTRCVKSRSKN